MVRTCSWPIAVIGMSTDTVTFPKCIGITEKRNSTVPQILVRKTHQVVRSTGGAIIYDVHAV
jgi:hypothetical protein